MALNQIGTVGSLAPSRSLFETIEKQDSASNAAATFSSYLNQAMSNTNNLLLDADKLADEFAAGKTDNIHQVAIAAEKADIALQFTMQIRSKILDAYSEIMRMQI